MGIKFEGLDEFRAAFERLRERSDEAASRVVQDHMEHDVFPETQARVPVMTGRLKETGRVVRGDEKNSFSVMYGDSPVNDDTLVDYAAAVHEREARHAPPTGTKFVQEPLEKSVDRLAEKAAKAFEDLAGG